ncbi:hypothetical protein KBX06_21495 [Micromonospora sp. C31]|nr:hypothetical protein [Micromonospora sp. C31]MBQ1075711.1 hypothetical protein [Micromonospora sp. C31]
MIYLDSFALITLIAGRTELMIVIRRQERRGQLSSPPRATSTVCACRVP